MPWRKNLKRFVTRYYTFSFSLGAEFLQLLDELISTFRNGESFKEERWIGEKSLNIIDIFPKLYDYPKAFSRYLHKEAKEKGSEFELEGPMVFHCLKLGIWTKTESRSEWDPCCDFSWDWNSAFLRCGVLFVEKSDLHCRITIW